MPPDYDWSTAQPYRKPRGEVHADAIREAQRIAAELGERERKIRAEAEMNPGLRIVLGLDDATDER